jgi:reductive dehalogenase
MPFAQRWDPKPSRHDYIPPELVKRPPDNISKDRLTHYVKQAAKYFGADQVGITALDPHWLYEGNVKMKGKRPYSKEDIQTSPFDIPHDVTNVIVIAIEMEPKGVCNAPNFLEVASVGWGYSQMTIIAASVAQFIRNLGYFAIPATNDTALSIPLAIDAGLGAQGRNGILLTKKWGPRVRLCKILTNMPLLHDSPDLSFIEKVNNFCKTCFRCANNCEAEAISFADEPTRNPKCSSNNPGVKKWYVNTNACYSVWVKYSTDCGKCIQVCPFSKTPSPMTPEEFWDLPDK